MAAERAVETGEPAHFEDLPNAIALFTHQPAAGFNEFNFAAGIRAVAELIFQPPQMQRIALTVGKQTGHEKAGETFRRLSENQVRIALRNREKPFVTDQMIKAFGSFFRPGGIDQDIRSPCFSVIPMPISTPRF
ncbi:Uncharacterised protein [Raoultella ornithinolytica]|nr:Uncharacterised protein [Raoultella ornithinolytica]